MKAARRLVVLAGAALLGALGLLLAPRGGAPAGAALPADPAARNQDVMERLKVTCAICHGEGTNAPFFASLKAFEDLLVYNRYHVVPGKPEQSELLRLLAGKGTRTYRQMPVNGDSFAGRDGKGQTRITMAELEQWIAELAPRPTPPPLSAVNAASLRRLGAEQVVRSLQDQLGLTEADLFPMGAGAFTYAVRSPDALGREGPARANQLFEMLGGPDWLNGKRRANEVSVVFSHALVQIAQSWCRLGVKKPGNTALLRHAKLADKSAGAAAAIRKNIEYLHLRMLGEPAAADAVDDLYQNVFLAYEPKGAETAWTAVCAALVRDPLWLSY